MNSINTSFQEGQIYDGTWYTEVATTTIKLQPDMGFWLQILADHGVTDILLVGGVATEDRTYLRVRE